MIIYYPFQRLIICDKSEVTGNHTDKDGNVHKPSTPKLKAFLSVSLFLYSIHVNAQFVYAMILVYQFAYPFE